MSERKTVVEQCGAALDDLRPLLAPHRNNALGQLMPPLSREALSLSCDIVNATYAMDVEAWINAGWRDVTFQLERDLHSGFGEGTESATVRGRLAAEMRTRLTQLRGKTADPLTNMAGALRQINHESDTGKALVMLRPTGDGRYVVAISFMGTTTKIYDWISNFRMDVQEGMHRGFLQLTRHFESYETKINFPETARELGLPSLTLADILTEAGRGDSRFLIWLTGHSQGGALVQVYAHHKLLEAGVLPQNISGYCFAAPSVAADGLTDTPWAYPIYLVENTDDAVPRSGALYHLGERLIFRADPQLRSRCYDWPLDIRSVRARSMVRPFIRSMTDMPHILEMMDAFMRTLVEKPLAEVMEALGTGFMARTPIAHLANAADTSVDAMMMRLCAKSENAYQSLTGREMDPLRIARIQADMQTVMHTTGVKGFMQAMAQLASQPHSSRRKGGAESGAYPYIAMQDPQKLVHAVWQGKPLTLRRSDDLGAMLVAARRASVARRPARIPHTRAKR